jgi:hypothetical protein
MVVMEGKLQCRFFLAAAFACCVFALLGKSTRPLLADGAIIPQPISYSPMDTTPSPSGSMARTKKVRIACYPIGGECTKNSDCCTGFCRGGRIAAYCDNP